MLCLFQSDPDQGPGSPHRSPSPTDDVFLGPASSPPGHAPPPPPYMPPQPSIEEARQQMHSLLDDAFALVSPTSQGNTAGITLPGVNSNPPGSSPPGRGPRPWGPSYQALCPFPGVSSHLCRLYQCIYFDRALSIKSYWFHVALIKIMCNKWHLSCC